MKNSNTLQRFGFVLVAILLLASSDLWSQTFTGPTEVCKNRNNNYSYYDDVEYTSVIWNTTGGGTIVSGTGLSRVIKWSSDGSVTVTMYNGGVVVSQDTKYVSVLLAGTISGPSSVCAGGSATLNLSGANSPNFTWQYSTAGSNGPWTTITTTGGTSLNHTPTSTTWYQAYPSTCTPDISQTPAQVVYYSPPSGGTLSLTSATNVCVSSGGSATANLSVSGYSPSINTWQFRYKNGPSGGWSGWSVFSTANQSTNSYGSLQPASVSQERYYEFMTSSNSGSCATAWSSVVGVTVWPVASGGSMGGITTQFCTSNSVNLSVSGVQGTGGYFEVRSKTQNGSWTGWTACSSTHPVSPSGGEYVDYEFHWLATTGGGCGSVPSNTVSTRVFPASSLSSVSVNQTQFCSSGTVNISISSFVGDLEWKVQYKDGAGSYNSPTTYSWDEALGTQHQLTSGSGVTRTYKFSVTATSGNCSAVAQESAEVMVYPASAIGTLSVSPGLEYYQSSPSLSLSVSSATGGVTYQYSTDGTNWYGTSSSPGAVSQSTQFKATATSGMCAPVSTTPVTVNIYPSPVITVNGPMDIPVGGTTELLVQCSFSQFQWVKDNVDIPNATSCTYSVTEPGEYKVKVKASATAAWATALPVTIGSALLSQPQNINYMVVTNISKDGYTQPTNFYSLAAEEISQAVTYMDGYGRTVQRVAIGRSPQRHDLVQPYKYDWDGRMPTRYLGYASNTISGKYAPNALLGSSGYTNSDQYLFYANGTGGVTDTYPYAVSVFDQSPLSRVTEQGAPGQDWQPGSNHTVKQVFNVNNASWSDPALKNIKLWTVNGPTGSNYADNQLAISTTTDENGNKVWVFSDKIGRTVLKRTQLDESLDLDGTMVSTPFLETYYVYDTRGNLAIQVPPKAVAKLNNGTSWSTNFRDEWCFTYTYDERNRLIEKKVPGAGPMYYGYDPLDRIVLVQDAFLRTTNQWMFVKYDIRGRAMMQGLYTINTHTTRDAIQTNVLNGLYANANDPYYEERGSAVQGYTNLSFPTQNADASALTILSVSYFDNYDFDHNGTDDYSYTAQGLTGEGVQASSYGLPTGSKRLILGTSDWLVQYVFYDKYGRAIQVRSNNHLSLALDNLTTNVYDFKGQVLLTKTYHNGGGSNQLTTINRFDYDFAGRLLHTYQSINGAPEVVTTAYKYNELGQLMEKNLHCTDCTDPAASESGTVAAGTIERDAYNSSEKKLLATESITLSPGFHVTAGNNFEARIASTTATIPSNGGEFMQSVDYRYNIRGWLTSINNAQLTNDGVLNDDTGDFFGMVLRYNESEGGSFANTPYYNGNISAVKWKGAFGGTGAEAQRSYKFAYDKADRLKDATYRKRGAASWDQDNNVFNENMTYDHNGNIMALQRNTVQRTLQTNFTITTAARVIDQLVYSYSAGAGNQLTKVEDSGTDEGFNNAFTANDEYEYNANGSMTRDKNRGIDSIAYNFLGKPVRIEFTDGRAIEYTYDASGNKLTVKNFTGTTLDNTTAYAGGIIYEGSGIGYFGSPGGRVVKKGEAFEYQYAISDHQGNTRVLFGTDTPDPDTYTATFEDNTQAQEMADFQNYPTNSAWRSSLNMWDHTDAGTTYVHSQLLNGAANGQVGLAKTLKVYPGDVISAQVYAKYFDNEGGTSNLAGFASALTAAFGLGAGSSGEALKAFTALQDFGSVVVANGGSGSPSAPKAFITILLFDRNFNFVDLAFEQIDAGATATHDLLEAQIAVEEPGYAYIYISNENPNLIDVYFDDMTVTHTKSPVIQYNEYYPYGLQNSQSWTRENNSNNFLYNAGTELNAASGLYDLFFRNYDPTVGRMSQVDPVAGKYGGITPYGFAFNDPVFWSDPFGNDPDEKTENEKKEEHEDAHAGSDPFGQIWEIIETMWNNTPENGFSTWSGGETHYYDSDGNGGYTEISGPGSSFNSGMMGTAEIGIINGVVSIYSIRVVDPAVVSSIYGTLEPQHNSLITIEFNLTNSEKSFWDYDPMAPWYENAFKSYFYFLKETMKDDDRGTGYVLNSENGGVRGYVKAKNGPSSGVLEVGHLISINNDLTLFWQIAAKVEEAGGNVIPNVLADGTWKGKIVDVNGTVTDTLYNSSGYGFMELRIRTSSGKDSVVQAIKQKTLIKKN